MNADELRCLFHATVEERDGSYIIEVPHQEVDSGGVHPEMPLRVGLFPPAVQTEPSGRAVETESGEQTRERTPESARQRSSGPEPPVSEGDQRTVDIQDIGEQGDGIARVDRGYIVIVPDTEQGERVRIEITDVAETVGFAEVVSREPYYE